MDIPHVLLTGGSGFIASHILDTLLARQYHVTVTVRSEVKGLKIRAAYPENVRERLSFVAVEDIVREGAFDEAVRCHPFKYVIHTACPYHLNVTDPLNDFINPAIQGTTGILKSVKDYAPLVERVVLLSSSATIFNPFSHAKVYDESVYGETTWEEAMSVRLAYRAAKIYAEKAAFDFMSAEKTLFDLVVLNPPLVFGPAPRHLTTLESLNTSNHRIRNLIMGEYRDNLPPAGLFIFCDVRDVAEAHARALEVPEASGQRFFLVGGYFSNKRIADVIRASHPEMDGRLPSESTPDDMPADVYGWDNSKSCKMLGMEYRDLKTCVDDSVDSFMRIGKIGL
ncbi:putative NAD dependent epimerase/dehydratase [Hypoxylon rubiginosum]|uniref:NAD dependent epimerase/dehydratase n=1 Tax=Hypoxylon rubiginosum TaxID=110542 RepID=A0ACB9YIQ2_9PEZI|nr:putative NAD dependent epimerase/dehydratase [Hypoxylon rubiginosum]